MYYNVLPPEVKKGLQQEYRARLVAVACWGLVAVALIAGASLVPAYGNLLALERYAEASRQAIDPSKREADVLETTSLIKATKEKMSALEEEASLYTVHDLVSKILSVKPAGVSVGDIVYEAKDGKRLMIVRGMATTRDGLTTFRTQLIKTRPFEKADLPIGVFAKSVDVPFSMTVQGAF